MKDWKEEDIKNYLAIEDRKKEIEKERANDTDLLQRKAKLDTIKQQVHVQERGYEIQIENVNAQMENIRERIIEHWDSEDKSFRCDIGTATIRITRFLKVDSKGLLINILQKIGKLEQCIKSWDLTYLRKLADAGLFDVDVEGMNIVHYDEKRNVLIGAIKNREG